MMQLTLNDSEAALLKDLLLQERGDVRNMIHHSRTHDAKTGLHERLGAVEELLNRLHR